MTKNEQEKNWKEGFHVSSDGFKCKLSELSDEHLQRSINKYKKTHDITPLEKELLNRV